MASSNPGDVYSFGDAFVRTWMENKAQQMQREQFAKSFGLEKEKVANQNNQFLQSLRQRRAENLADISLRTQGLGIQSQEAKTHEKAVDYTHQFQTDTTQFNYDKMYNSNEQLKQQIAAEIKAAGIRNIPALANLQWDKDKFTMMQKSWINAIDYAQNGPKFKPPTKNELMTPWVSGVGALAKNVWDSMQSKTTFDPMGAYNRAAYEAEQKNTQLYNTLTTPFQQGLMGLLKQNPLLMTNPQVPLSFMQGPVSYGNAFQDKFGGNPGYRSPMYQILNSQEYQTQDYGSYPWQ